MKHLLIFTIISSTICAMHDDNIVIQLDADGDIQSTAVITQSDIMRRSFDGQTWSKTELSSNPAPAQDAELKQANDAPALSSVDKSNEKGATLAVLLAQSKPADASKILTFGCVGDNKPSQTSNLSERDKKELDAFTEQTFAWLKRNKEKDASTQELRKLLAATAAGQECAVVKAAVLKNGVDAYWGLPLGTAVTHNNEELVRSLLDLKADPNAGEMTQHGVPSILVLAQNPKISKMLQDAGAYERKEIVPGVILDSKNRCLLYKDGGSLDLDSNVRYRPGCYTTNDEFPDETMFF